MKNLQISIVISISFIFSLIGLTIVFGQSPSGITINGTLKSDNLESSSVSLPTNNKICPDNKCIIEFQNAMFSGIDPDKILTGMLKVEDKSNFSPDFKLFTYYKVFGNFNLNSSKEVVRTGQKYLFYSGKIGIDRTNAMISPEFNFDSQVTLNQNKFMLIGKGDKASDVLQMLVEPVTQNASAIGDNKANITLIEFGDYQCKYCAKFYRETRSQIVNNYVTPGEVKFLFKDFIINNKPGDNSSTLAAIGSYCAAEQGKYWDYHDELYRNSKGENITWVTKETLKKFGTNINIPDIVKFSDCLESQRYSNLVIQNDNFAKNIGLTSPPSFILVAPGKQPLAIIGAQPYSVFEQAIKQIKS